MSSQMKNWHPLAYKTGKTSISKQPKNSCNAKNALSQEESNRKIWTLVEDAAEVLGGVGSVPVCQHSAVRAEHPPVVHPSTA